MRAGMGTDAVGEPDGSPSGIAVGQLGPAVVTPGELLNALFQVRMNASFHFRPPVVER